ncbi:MAG: trigger factor, partial [Alphaproteobacteria bacterium]|nr:trigger factor [Alphaproteobacteria bacterium]
PSDKKIAEKGDTVSMNFVGKKDGVAFDGGTAENFMLEIGSNRLIPGFEDQLIGHSVGETFTFPITFPANYPSASLAGEEVEFTITLNAIMEFANADINDDLALQTGFANLDELKGVIRKQMSIGDENLSRVQLKKQLFDQLDKLCDFPLPNGLVEQEHKVLKQQFEAELAEQAANPDVTAEPIPEDKVIEQLAHRRVKLGMVLSDLARQQGIHLTQNDMRQVLSSEAARYPGQAEKVIAFYQKYPEQLQRLTAPMLEEKAVDYVLTQAKVQEKLVSRVDLIAEQEKASLGDVLMASAPTSVAVSDDSAVDHDAHTCNDPTYNH